MQQPQRLSRPGAERTDNASHPRGLLLPRAVPPAGKFSLRTIACLTLQGRRVRDRRGPVEKDLESSAGCGGGGRSRLLTWATRNGPGLRLAAPGAAREWGAHHCLGRRPRPCPRRLFFLPRARHVTAIKHVCALRRGDFLILARATHSPSPPPPHAPPLPPALSPPDPGGSASGSREGSGGRSSPRSSPRTGP